MKGSNANSYAGVTSGRGERSNGNPVTTQQQAPSIVNNTAGAAPASTAMTAPVPTPTPQLQQTAPIRVQQSNPQQQHSIGMWRNQDDDFINRIKEFKANCIIVFRIKEESEDIDNQNDIDRFHMQDILSDLNLEQLSTSLLF